MRKGILWCLITLSALSLVTFSCSFSGPSSGEAPAAPAFSMAGGVFSEEVAVKLTTQTPGAVIHYTLDGTNPGPDSEIYTDPIEIPGDWNKKILRACAEKNGVMSAVSEDCYTVKPKDRVATPLLMPPKGIYPFPIAVSLYCTTVGAEIHYTLDGSEPDDSSPVYCHPIPVKCGSKTKIRTIAYKPGLACSTKATGLYSVKLEGPVLSLSGQIIFRTKRDLMEAFDPDSGQTYSEMVEELYKTLPDGSLQVRMTTAEFNTGLLDFIDYLVGSPCWAPDHTRILYKKLIQALGDGDLDDSLFMMNGDGSGEIALPNLDLGTILNPCFSPDGTKIIFETVDPDDVEKDGVYMMSVDGTEVTKLISSVLDGESPGDFHPSWSPDSMLYVIASGGQLCIYSPETGLATMLSLGTADSSEPDYCPTGNKIVFTASVYGHKKIFVVNLDTSICTQLTDGDGDDEDPCWSPDGTQIAFTTNRDGNKEVYVINADGTHLMDISNNPADDELVGW